MYPAPPVNLRFNYQPMLNSTQMNGILRNQNEMRQVNIEEKQSSSSSDVNSKRKNASTLTANTEKSPKKHPKRFSNQDRLISRQSNLERIPVEPSTPLLNSRSSGTLHDRIQRERRAHTMAPLGRISGPSSTPQAAMFATINAPIENQINKSQEISNISYSKSHIETTDDDTPIIVKVRYNPQAHVLPSEDAIRKAIDKQIFNKKTKKDPIIVDFFGQDIQPQLPNRIQKNPFPPRISRQSSRTLPSMSHPFLNNTNIYPGQAPKPLINQSLNIPRLPNRNINSSWTNEVHPTGFNTLKMATRQSSTTTNNQQTLSVFRPPAVKDTPELSRENLLRMLNQIPDLQGRRFNIEYAPPSAPEGYPIPFNLNTVNNTYPEPVVIHKLPTNLIQHIKSSNNPALTAALEATIQQEQHVRSQPAISTLNVQPLTVIHHAAQPYQQVQQSRPASSNDSASSTEDVSSSQASSSEETDSEESESVPSTKSENNLSFIGPIPPNQYR